MFKTVQPSAPVVNVTAGQNATLDLNVGPRYHNLKFIATVTKTAAGSAAAALATLADALGMFEVKIGTVSKRTHTADELDQVQTEYGAEFAAQAYPDTANDLITSVAAVGPVTFNGVANCYTRTTTFIFTLHFTDPSRDTMDARQYSALPTKWASGREQKVQLSIGIPNNTTNGLTRANIGTTMAGGSVLFENPVVRCDEAIDFTLGEVGSQAMANAGIIGQASVGQDILPMIHFFRQSESYNSTSLIIRKWPFNGGGARGYWQQATIFMPQSSDGVATYQLLGNNILHGKGSKASSDLDKRNYNWNFAAFTPARFSLAFDFSNEPADAYPQFLYDPLELNLTLLAANAANKSAIILSQVFKNAIGA